ncbi:peptide ABC transporter substrate-binding protein [Fenollaria massiliensis]|uniref:Peptide ABC transporter substrate-binding protein n=1 Tax=Fenollaria massiliensis TaxID=938288 RepID=A0A9E7DIY9_9FIRM|nr:peptide ABC transporter substrate-binding protein [Fenollaria massiliensis]UQK58805.1 peptide ABC transporter substrate-binding protein [Fenollaria massiliensis]
MKSKKFLALLLVLVMAISVLASCKPADKPADADKPATTDEGKEEGKEEAPADTGALTEMPTDGEPDADQYINTFDTAHPNTLDPAKGSDSYGNGILLNILEPLVRIQDVKGQMGSVEYVPAGAESWDLSEDGLTYTFHVREGNVWNDGTPVTAKDYEYGIKRCIDPRTACPYANNTYYIKGAEKVNKTKLAEGQEPDYSEVGVVAKDDKTLEITLEHPVPFFIDIVTTRIFFPQRQDLVEQYQDTYSTSPETAPQCGPFILKDWVINSEQNYVKNDNYWDKDNVKLSKYKVSIIKDSNTIFNALKAGQIDYAGVGDPKWKGEFLNNPDYYSTVRANPDTTYFMFNCNADSNTANNKVRQAISIALDRQELIDSCYNGVPTAAFDFVPPAVTVQGKEFNKLGEGWVKKLAEDNPDPKALFEEGVKEAGLGDPSSVTIKLMGSDTSQEGRTSGEFVQQCLEEALGCKVEVDNQDWSQFINIVQTGKGWDIAWLAWGADFNDPSNFLETCHSQTAAYPTGYKNEEFDKLLDEAKVEQDADKRVQLFHDAEKILLYDDAALSPVIHRIANVFRRSYIRNANYSFFSTMGMSRIFTSGRK